MCGWLEDYCIRFLSYENLSLVGKSLGNVRKLSNCLNYYDNWGPLVSPLVARQYKERQKSIKLSWFVFYMTAQAKQASVFLAVEESILEEWKQRNLARISWQQSVQQVRHPHVWKSIWTRLCKSWRNDDNKGINLWRSRYGSPWCLFATFFSTWEFL